MKKRIITIAAICCIAALCIAGAAYAYLFHTETDKEIFTSGKVDGNLITNMTNTTATVYPCETFNASPKITLATASEDAIAFIEFEYPCDTSVDIYDDSGNKITTGELFEVSSTLGTGWEKLDVTATPSQGCKREVYGYNQKLSNDTNGVTQTTICFEKYAAANFTQNNAISSKEVRITGCLMQADGVLTGTGSPITTEELVNAYNKLKVQKN